jgi:hypothetical protein
MAQITSFQAAIRQQMAEETTGSTLNVSPD